MNLMQGKHTGNSYKDGVPKIIDIIYNLSKLSTVDKVLWYIYSSVDSCIIEEQNMSL